MGVRVQVPLLTNTNTTTTTNNTTANTTTTISQPTRSVARTGYLCCLYGRLRYQTVLTRARQQERTAGEEAPSCKQQDRSHTSTTATTISAILRQGAPIVGQVHHRGRVLTLLIRLIAPLARARRAEVVAR